ncbi:MAG: DUF362 domain-containing protein [bacterium]
MKETVSIVKCSSYNQEMVDDAVREAMDLIGGMKKFVKKGDRVLLKVNLLMPKPPSAGVTTHPAVMVAAAKLVKEAGGKPAMGDSSMWQTKRSLKLCGVEEAAEEVGAEVWNLEESKPKRVKIKGGGGLEEIFISSKVFEADVIISLCKLKVHELTLFTGAVKNMFGTVQGRHKAQVHRNSPKPKEFSEALLNIYSHVTPHLSIMDGIMSVQGSAGVGPTRKMKVVLASANAVALDTVAAKLIGYRSRELPVNRAAKRRGLSGASMDEITVKGASISSVRNRSFMKPPLPMRFFMANPQLNPIVGSQYKPKVRKSKCVKCGICEKHCPVGAIKLDPTPVFDYEKCIQCYCCREGCKEGAIRFKESLLAKLITASMSGW